MGNDGGERIEIDPGMYVAVLEQRVADLTVELVRSRAALEALTRRMLEIEGAFQTDGNGELVAEGGG